MEGEAAVCSLLSGRAAGPGVGCEHGREAGREPGSGSLLTCRGVGARGCGVGERAEGRAAGVGARAGAGAGAGRSGGQSQTIGSTSLLPLHPCDV